MRRTKHNDNRRLKLVKLIATCGALDKDDLQPAVTVMLPDEDWPATVGKSVCESTNK